MSTNELAVVAVLVCGHHAECLEPMNLEVSKYDPACPVCTFGEQQSLKLFEKAIKAEMESRLKHSKRSRSRIVDSEFETSFVGDVAKGVKIDSSSGTMNASFLKRHFWLGTKGNKPSLASLSRQKEITFMDQVYQVGAASYRMFSRGASTLNLYDKLPLHYHFQDSTAEALRLPRRSA